jgi:hypothetical protein
MQLAPTGLGAKAEKNFAGLEPDRLKPVRLET